MPLPAKSMLLLSVCLAACIMTLAQTGTRFDLAEQAKNRQLTVYNRDLRPDTSGNRHGIKLDLREGEGLVWINGARFSTGTIEIDLKGQDVFQHSFLGIAFHGVDDSTFEAIYFRPFQFRSTDPVRKTRGIQYICLPDYTWQRLRAEFPGQYESEVEPPPDPNDWFHARIVVDEHQVCVYLNDSTSPLIRAKLLGNQEGQRIALYTADRSGGSFANLIIRTD